MMKFKTAIFDLDGTLLNTLEDLSDAVNYALKQKAYPLRTMEEVRCFIGNGVEMLIRRAVPSGNRGKRYARYAFHFPRLLSYPCSY